MNKIVIIDYGLSNIFNVWRALNFIGVDSIISSNLREIKSADKIILPGVGAFGAGMKSLKETGIAEILSKKVNQGTYILGICLGMQMFMGKSYEYGEHNGLGFIEGEVISLSTGATKIDVKIPQVGWNKINPFNSNSKSNKDNSSWKKTILEDISQDEYMYFVHSYRVKANNRKDILAETVYGKDQFCSVVRKDNVMGCQFHPERSGIPGLKILKNFSLL